MTEKCTICLEDIETDKQETRCNHTFHKECLDKWTVNTCPVCRSVLDETKPVVPLTFEPDLGEDLLLAIQLLYEELYINIQPVVIFDVNYYLE